MYRYLREDVKKLKPYQVMETEFKIKLDANEGVEWMEGLNRYPEDGCPSLRKILAERLGKVPGELLIGNGSSELIELAMKAYLDAGETVVSIWPTFSMYRIFTIIHKGIYEDYPLEDMRSLNVDGFINFINEKKAKLVIISNPNNPTGTLIPRNEILKIIESVDAMVVLDEAYVEFSQYPVGEVTRDYNNLLVLRTFSKARALAGIRLGYMIGQEEVIGYINRVRSPYNVNLLSQQAAIGALEKESISRANVQMIKTERKRMKIVLEERGYKPISSQGNFLFFTGSKDLYERLKDRGILIRSFEGELEGYYRLTIGTPEENSEVVKAIEEEVQNERVKGD